MPLDGTYSLPLTRILLDGRAQIERGWVQHYTHTRSGVCLIGSLHDAPDSSSSLAAQMFLLAAVKETGFAKESLPLFNDAPGRTKEEILAVYDRAIELSLS